MLIQRSTVQDVGHDLFFGKCLVVVCVVTHKVLLFRGGHVSLFILSEVLVTRVESLLGHLHQVRLAASSLVFRNRVFFSLER